MASDRGIARPPGVAVAAFTPAWPEWVLPTFSLSVLIGVGLPLFVVTMASQNVPGVAVLRACGYDPPVSAIVGWTGAVTVVLAPLGGFALNLAAITATIGNGLAAATADERRREPALLTFLVTLSGVTLFSIGAAF